MESNTNKQTNKNINYDHINQDEKNGKQAEKKTEKLSQKKIIM
mgnify:CR=1 FL=1